ncbi:UDP-N-acetylmuramoyl-tripeptide--D-alanyl-D-alanine ligase [Shewanella marina]|uniref:UDP-N-acetylmuramoyl-tripeptide--D-alanyl-D- alanine ligase n=1 Tax=Shewanella marina TaxID=487319 RepID=UPI00047042A7|nr:UDP-N-acetylmuramoyl-tripeptide--D-alanyl-D-alanine ligase [Shewanella marina]
MIPLSLAAITAAVNGQLIGADSSITSVSTDSRNIAEHCLFVALKGERFDGHDFVAKAVELGAQALLVERPMPFDIAQIVVTDSQQAMAQIGVLVKQAVAPICVALTGSNGKTSVKEMVATILSAHHQVLYTAGNFNNDIGVPLTMLRLQQGDQYGVFELGANHLGEIDYTSNLVQPKVALVNNVAGAHLEGFGSLEGVAKAKSEIFNHLATDGVAIINADDAFADVMRTAAGTRKIIQFSATKVSDIYATGLCADSIGRYQFTLHYGQQQRQVKLPLTGRHQVSNALASTAMCIALNIDLNEIVYGLTQLKPVKGRMMPVDLGRILVVDDSYNANPASVTAAINWLHEISTNRILVLGDLGELGDNAPLLHQQLGELAQQQAIDALFCVGQLSRQTALGYGSGHFDDIAQLNQMLIAHLNQLSGPVTVLVKGSRSAAMERVVDALTAAYGRGELV